LIAAAVTPSGSLVRLAVPVSVAFLPQMTFISAYTNTDAYTASVCTFMLFACVYGILHRWNWRAAALLGTAGGLVLLGKYNGYLILPVSGLIVLLSAPRLRTALAVGLIASAVVIALAGWWFARSLHLYGDPLGFRPQLEAIHAVAPHIRNLAAGHDLVWLLTQTDWFITSFFSSFAVLGQMNIKPPVEFYVTWTAFVLVVFVAVTVCLCSGMSHLWRVSLKSGVGAAAQVAWRCRRRAVLLVACGILLLGGLTQSALNSLTFDYQPQGRYLLFAVAPFFLLAYTAIERAFAGNRVPQQVLLWAAPTFFAFTNLFAYVELLRPSYIR
jgi:4-amino-4-deoxy-L-arabinose transferase-like glycosyltransferase